MPTPYALSSDLVSAWPAKSLEVATYLDTALAAKYDSAPAINAQTGTTYTFVLADATAGKTITASNASASTYTVPPQSSVTFVAGALLRVTNLGAGVVTFAGGSGVTVTNTAGTLAQYQTATLVRTGSDAWTVIRQGSASGLVHLNTYDFSAASSFSISNVFSAAYTDYRVILNATPSTIVEIRFRLRVGGVDSTAASSDFQVTTAGASTVSTARSTGQTYNYLVKNSGVGSTKSYAQMEMSQPFEAAPTLYTNTSMNWAGINQIAVAGIHNVSTSYDSITFLTDTGNITGSVSIFGYSRS